MAYAPKRSAAAADAANDAQCALVNSGSIKIYTIGAGVPAAVADAVSGTSTLLATLPLDAAAFGSSSGGVATNGTITDDSDADATGTAAFFRLVSSGGTAVFQGLVGTTGCDLNLNTVSIVEHAAVSVTSLTITEALA
jgi:hypothetical protein